MFKTLALPFTGRARSDTISIFGHLARRLDISLPSGWDRPRWGGEDFLKLFRLTPNLTTVRTDYQVFKWIMADSLWKDATLPNLGRVDLAESFKTPIPPFASRYLALLDSHPNQRLDLMASRLVRDIPALQLHPTTQCWPIVREIDFFPAYLATLSAIFPPGSFPNKAAALCHFRALGRFERCLQIHGRHLRSDSIVERDHERSLSTGII
ncbi:hypothetical protein FA13DRAFT_19355 [Coprinellus micaceus]|uniref:Uncharacterized protein n=1 Tax=Coprinellus micaceus TaxID=71717 RepID=A0A4Y7TZV0_COPMI|nr:hypothetical protein FA13DRAFT_19355 [Coprinellus micaceus]